MENILILGRDEEYEEIYSISIHEDYKNHEKQESENNIGNFYFNKHNKYIGYSWKFLFTKVKTQ